MNQQLIGMAQSINGGSFSVVYMHASYIRNILTNKQYNTDLVYY